MGKNIRKLGNVNLRFIRYFIIFTVASLAVSSASALENPRENAVLGQSSYGSIITIGDSPAIAESVGRGEHRLLIHYRKRYLDDAALDHYLSGAGWTEVVSVGRAAAFYYLDYSSRREFSATIHPDFEEERLFFDEETGVIGEEYASWARDQLKYNHLNYEEEILLLLLAEIKYDQEFSRHVDSLAEFNIEMSLYLSGGGRVPHPPRLSYNGSVKRLELVVAGYPASPAALYAWYFLGCILGDLGDAESSEYCFSKTLDFGGGNPYYNEAALRSANIALDNEEYEKAEEYYKSVADNSEFRTDALYGLAYVNYVLAGVGNDPKRDKAVLGYFGELYSISRNELITEYCANLAVASLSSLGGYTGKPPPDDVNMLFDKYAGYLDNPDAEAYLIDRMGGVREDMGP